MASTATPGQSLYLGVDPGATGCLAALAGPTVSYLTLASATTSDVWAWLCGFSSETAVGLVYAVVEEQVPRPTRFFDKSTMTWKSSILRSTCVLYASYHQLLALLTAAHIPFEAMPPQRWQKYLHIPPRTKPEAQPAWKRRLRDRAARLFPTERVTSVRADALLLAAVCRRWYTHHSL